MEELKLIRTEKRIYLVSIPKRLQSEYSRRSKIQIGFKHGEFQYLPRKKTFMTGIRLSSDELKAIVKELDRLNECVKRGLDA